MRQQIKTGISGLDDLLVGGIPKNNCVLVAGSAGTGKTVLTQQFLFNGAKQGENGIYICLVEAADSVISNMSSFKFYDQKIMDTDKVKVVNITKNIRLKGLDFDDISGVLDIIREMIEESGAKRVVIDSITAVCQNIEEKDKIRDLIMELGFMLRYLDCTTMIISEIPPQTFQYSMFGVEEFIADGVILLSDFERKGELIRTLQVIKMRGIAHSRNKQVLKIMEEGINLLPMFKADVQ